MKNIKNIKKIKIIENLETEPLDLIVTDNSIIEVPKEIDYYDGFYCSRKGVCQFFD